MGTPTVSIVTISFNQSTYLTACIDSVLSQKGDFKLEYIVVDPGSTDLSRSIIDSYGDRLSKIYEEDKGPADGLNRGFSRASGDYFLYLNSDDVLLPDAIQRLVSELEHDSNIDVVFGHGWIIDENGNRKRKCYSDAFTLLRAAYGTSIIIQPSSAFRSSKFKACGGFNDKNRSNWDGELFIDMAIKGARFRRISSFLSEYRIHSQGITGTGKMSEAHHQYSRRMFFKIMKRPWGTMDNLFAKVFRLVKHLTNPKASLERLQYGPIFGTGIPRK